MDTAVVTGASRGIGAAVATHFAEQGVHIVVCSREADAVEALVSDLERAGGSATGMRADVRDEFDLERLMERAARAGDESGIDCVVASAGVYHGSPGESPLRSESYTAFDDTLRVNARGVFTTIREALPHLTDHARMLVPSGPVAREARAGVGSYAVSKAAAEAIVRQFALEIDQAVGVVDPGRVATELSGDADGVDPAEVAPLFWWAAAEADSDTVDGRVVTFDAYESAAE